jgi:hypothetical protein
VRGWLYHGDACTTIPEMDLVQWVFLHFVKKIIMMGHYLQHLADGRKAQAEQWTRTPSPARLELGSKVSISMPG